MNSFICYLVKENYTLPIKLGIYSIKNFHVTVEVHDWDNVITVCRCTCHKSLLLTTCVNGLHNSGEYIYGQ